MKFLKVDPITGQIVAAGLCPDSEELAPADHEGLLQFSIEGEPGEYRFDVEARQLVRTDAAAVADLRRLLAAENRAPTAEELERLGLT